MGYLTDWKVTVEFRSGDGPVRTDTLGPNRPSLHRGFNISAKDFRVYPYRAVLLRVNRDPGAVWALTGGVLTTVGIVILIMLRIRAEKAIKEKNRG